MALLSTVVIATTVSLALDGVSGLTAAHTYDKHLKGKELKDFIPFMTKKRERCLPKKRR